MPATAFAQSTGTVTTEEQIVITGARTKNVGGVQVPDTTKAKAVITKELIDRQPSGQTILNVINLVPGVNFTNSDPYGSSGGNIRIRGFDGNRISLTFDGVPLNDTGNYAIFSNQQLDPELIEQVNVGLGVTDVDSPTASAAGGTVNYRTIIPSSTMGARLSGSLGDWNYYRVFGLFNTGAFTPWGTKAWIAASHAKNDKFKGPGEINKYQFNGRIYQPIGSGGDFISIAGHYNRNRNNFYRNPSLTDLRGFLGTTEFPNISPTGGSTFVPSAATPFEVGFFNQSQINDVMAFDNLSHCNLTIPAAGVVQNDNPAATLGTGPNGTGPAAPPLFGSTQNNPLNTQSCTNYYGLRINPSNTGNIRGQSRFTLMDGLLLTVDPSYQYVLANGGGTTVFAENDRQIRGNLAVAGVDLNGDSDILDRVRLFTPNNTNTRRIGLTSSLIWDVNPDHRVRVAYTYDHGHHRQTGEFGYLESNADPENVFGGRNGRPVLDAAGNVLQQRDRLSIALLHQISGQWIGKFFEQKLRVEVGVRRPFFSRDLDQHCYTFASGSGFAYCSSEVLGTTPILPAAGNYIVPPDYQPPAGTSVPSNAVYAPFKAHYKFGKILPNVGFTYNFTPAISMFGSYAKGFSSPRTDNLYRRPRVQLDPEETNAFDLGARYSTSLVQAQLAAWKIDYKNRIVSSFNPDLGISLDRNVGKVDSWGFDGSVAVHPIRPLQLIALASYIKAKLKDNVELNQIVFPVVTPQVGLILCDGPPTATNRVALTCAPTAGRMVAETPKWQFGGRAQYDVGPFSFGLQGKHVGKRFATDVNDVVVKGYNLVDLDARVGLDTILHSRGTYLQFNLQNVFDQFYFGNLGTQINAAGNPNYAVGSPRTFSATLNVGL
jgi:iron complex outermembrane receptor protein